MNANQISSTSTQAHWSAGQLLHVAKISPLPGTYENHSLMDTVVCEKNLFSIQSSTMQTQSSLSATTMHYRGKIIQKRGSFITPSTHSALITAHHLNHFA